MISDFTRTSGDVNEIHSKIESERFGLSVGRLNIPIDQTVTDAHVAELCRKSKSDLLILRYPASRSNLSQILTCDSSKEVFHADTLVYFSRLLAIDEFSDSRDNQTWKLLDATDQDKEKLIELAAAIFEEYPNHYRANKTLDSSLIRQGFVQWATSGLRDASKVTVLISNEESHLVGFALVSINGDSAEIELNGVHPDFQRRGAYSALLHYVARRLSDRGVKSLSISTQIQNSRVIRTWIKQGFNFDFALNTFHLMTRK